MRIVNRTPRRTADINGERGKDLTELWRLLLFTAFLIIGIYLCVGLATDAVVARISFQTEAKLFGYLPIPSRIKKDSDEDLERLQDILGKLTPLPEVPPLPYHLVLIDDDVANAFAFPGGTIGVTRGLVDALEEDVELAFVLGHELGHFHNRDHLRGLGRAVGLGVTCTVLFGGSMGSDTTSTLFQQVLHRTYSRGQEEEADRFGVELVYRAYGRTAGVDRLFQIIKEKDHLPPWAYMFTTHPSPEERIARLQEYASALKPGEEKQLSEETGLSSGSAGTLPSPETGPGLDSGTRSAR